MQNGTAGRGARADGIIGEAVLGKKSGKESVKVKLEEYGLELDEEKAAVLLSEIKSLSIKERRLVTDEEFKELYNKVK